MRIDNELLTAARMADINDHRLRLWRLRWFCEFGEFPNSAEVITWPWQRKSLRQERHGNSHVIKFPAHKRQYIGVNLPTGPEAA